MPHLVAVQRSTIRDRNVGKIPYRSDSVRREQPAGVGPTALWIIVGGRES